jgi:hypothetical protein
MCHSATVVIAITFASRLNTVELPVIYVLPGDSNHQDECALLYFLHHGIRTPVPLIPIKIAVIYAL